jgi:hypothetical protein
MAQAKVSLSKFDLYIEATPKAQPLKLMIHDRVIDYHSQTA